MAYTCTNAALKIKIYILNGAMGFLDIITWNGFSEVGDSKLVAYTEDPNSQGIVLRYLSQSPSNLVSNVYHHHLCGRYNSKEHLPDN